jgi:hypothetical protein
MTLTNYNKRLTEETRHLIHKDKIGELKRWLIGEGYIIEEPQEKFEAIRATKYGDPIAVFYLKPTGDHLTTSGPSTRLAMEFLYGSVMAPNKKRLAVVPIPS